MPEILPLNQTTKPRVDLVIDQSPGDRNEIGLFTEWGSECIATGINCDTAIAQADALLDAPWCDRVTMQKRYYAGGDYSLSFEHTPNVFFLPYVLTGDKKYIAPMECQWQIYSEWRGFDPAGPMRPLYGRDMAWQLRNLAELAYIEKQGDTEKSIYVEALSRTLDKIRSDMVHPDFAHWHVLGWKYARETSCNETLNAGCYWNGWFEAFIGQVVNHIVQLGFVDWLPVAEWHFQHLKKRCGSEWPMKYCANSYVRLKRSDSWQTVLPMKEKFMVLLQNYPDDQITPRYLDGIGGITYSDRLESMRGWAAIAAQNGIPGAREMDAKLTDLIAAQSVKKYYKFNFE